MLMEPLHSVLSPAEICWQSRCEVTSTANLSPQFSNKQKDAEDILVGKELFSHLSSGVCFIGILKYKTHQTLSRNGTCVPL